MRPLLIALFFAASTYAQPFVFSPAARVTEPRSGFPAASFGDLRAANNGTNMLLVWSDDRAALPAHAEYGHQDTFATLVDGQGNVLNVPNLQLPGLGTSGWPFWDGRQYVVVGSAGTYVRISAAGELLDAAPRLLSIVPRGEIVDMVWSGERFLIVARPRYNGGPDQLWAAMYDRLLNPVRAEFLLDSGASYLGNIRIASNGSNFVVVEGGCCNAGTIALDREGSVIRRTPGIGADVYDGMALASNGDGYLLMAGNRPDQVTRQREFSALVLDSVGGPVFFHRPFGAGNILAGIPSALAWEGDSYQFVYPRGVVDAIPSSADQLLLRTITIDATGEAYDHVGMPLESLVNKPVPASVVAFVFAGKRVVVTLGRASFSGPLSWSGHIYDDPLHYSSSPQFMVGQGTLQQESPAAATAGDISLLVWRDGQNQSDPFALLAVRVDARGQVLDATPLRLASKTCDGTTPRVTTNGHDFFVAWQQTDGVTAMRVGRDGQLLDAQPLRIGAGQCAAAGAAAVAWNGSDYVVAWPAPKTTTALAGIDAVRVSPQGTVRDAEPIALMRAENLANVVAASDGNDWFLAWETPQNGVFGQRVTAAGVPLDGNGIGVALDIAHASSAFWTGSEYVVLSNDQDGIRPVRFTADGQHAGGPPFFAPIDARNPQVSCDATGCYLYGIADGVVYATRITSGAAGVTAASTPLAHTDGEWQQMIVFGSGRTQFGYLELRQTAPDFGSYHLFTSRLLPARGRAIR